MSVSKHFLPSSLNPDPQAKISNKEGTGSQIVVHCLYNLRALGFVELLGDRTLLLGFSYDQRENLTLLTPKAGEVSY